MVSVGNELLAGEVVDTNAAWLSRQLTALGVEVIAQVTVGDDAARLAEVIAALCDRCDVLVVGGGLGPTPDDLTREAVAAAAGVPLERRDELVARIADMFAARGVRMPPSNLRQAELPRGAEAFDPVGTAPGFRLEVRRGDRTCVVYALPGVPWELRRMFERDVAGELAARSGGATVTRTVHVTGASEAAVGERLAALRERVRSSGVDVAFLARERAVEVRITARAPTAAEAAAQAAAVTDEVIRLLGPAVGGVDDAGIEAVLVRVLRDRGETVAVAESATAGRVCARLAQVPGASAVLRGGVVVYATDSKRDVLGVPAEVLDRHGPVAPETTRAMAQRVRELFDADWGLATTGVAGPDPQGGRPVGTMVWALAAPDGTVEAHERQLPGDRLTIQERLATAALELLRRRLAVR